MDRFVIRKPPPPSVPTPSQTDQYVPNPNTFDNPIVAHAANEAAKKSLQESSYRKRKPCFE